MTRVWRVKALPGQFISLCGYAGAGKDVLAQHLLDGGYVRHNFGDVIKDFFEPFIGKAMSLNELLDAIHAHRAAGVTEADIETFMLNIAIPYLRAGHALDSFSEDRAVKPLFRPVLEHGGELVYDHIVQTYNAQLESLLIAGENVVNTRLCLIPEAMSAREYGGSLHLIQRNNWPPATDWDEKVIADLLDNGFITHTIYNDAQTAEEWDMYSRAYVLRNFLLRKENQAA